MTLLLTFLISSLCVSAVLYLAADLFLRVDDTVEQWPLLWATALVLSVLIPAAGIAWMMMPDWAAAPAFERMSLHEPLQSLGLMTPEPVTLSEQSTLFTLAHVGQLVAALYALGVVFTLLKLAFGRIRIHRLMVAADPLGTWCGDDVLRSPATQSPFAWTPFGRPDESRIVIPDTYPALMTRQNLTDILTHEREHIARRDDEAGLILRCVLCLCWMSPFAHALFGRWSQSTEIRCDMAVTAGRTAPMRKAYADTLLKALHIMAGRVVQHPAAAFSTPRIRNEKMRITHIMQGTAPTYKRSRDRLMLGVVACAVSALGMITISATAHAGNFAPKGLSAPNSPSAAKAESAPKAPEFQKASQLQKPSTAPKAPKATTQASAHTVSSAMVTGRLTSKFGPAKDPFNAGKTRNHHGIDIAAPTGTPIHAPANGVITTATNLYNGKPNYGKVVVLQTDDGVQTVFAHLDGYSVKAGQTVSKGTEIATIGTSGKSTGPHVHIETYQNGTRLDPQDVWAFGR